MSITGQEDNVISKESVRESTENTLVSVRAEIRHQANDGDLLIDLTNLTTPSESLSNGWSNPSLSEIQGYQLFAFRKSIKLISSRGVELTYLEDFTVVDDLTIKFIGDFANDGGTLPGETFRIVTPVPGNNILISAGEIKKRSYTLPANQTLLNLGVEYEVNKNPTNQIGAITVKRNGVELLRNTNNETASPFADGNYQEIENVISQEGTPTVLVDQLLAASTGNTSQNNDNSWEAQGFQFTSQLQITEIALELQRTTTTGNAEVAIYNDNSGEPGSQLAVSSVPFSTHKRLWQQAPTFLLN